MSILQPVVSLRHLETNRYPLCGVNLSQKPGWVLRSVSPAIIDTRGTFPYLLFRLKHEESGLVFHCIRGSASFPSHQAIARLYTASLSARFHVEVQGGGLIHFGGTSVQVHGTSEAYGRADHHLVGKVIKFCRPSIKVQYEPANPPTSPVKQQRLTVQDAKQQRLTVQDAKQQRLTVQDAKLQSLTVQDAKLQSLKSGTAVAQQSRLSTGTST